MTVVRWTPQAADDLEEIHEFIARDSEHYARLVIERIVSSVDVLMDFPRVGRVVPELQQETVRELIQDPYRVVYRLEGEEAVRILTVFRASRRLPILPV